MSNNAISIEALLKSIEEYTLTNLQLYKLYVVDFVANIFAEIYTKLIVMALLVSCILFFSIGISLWIGDLLGKNYYGFLVVSGVYLCIILIFIQFKQYLFKDPMYNCTARKIK